MSTVNELIKRTPLDAIASSLVPAGQVVDLVDSAACVRQIAESNQQITKLLNTLSSVSVKDVLTTIGTQGNAANLLALSSLRQAGSLDNVSNIVDALSIIDSDDNVLMPYGRKTSKGVKAVGRAIEGIVDLVPLSIGVKLALKGSIGFLAGALVEFAPEIGDLIYEGFRAVEYEMIELVIDKLFRDNNVTVIDSGQNDCCYSILDAFKRAFFTGENFDESLLKKALLTPENKSEMSKITQAIRAGLLDFARTTDWNLGETQIPITTDFDDKPYSLDNRPLIDKLIKAFTIPAKIDGDCVDAVYRQPIQHGQQVKHEFSFDKPEFWELWRLFRTAFLQPKKDAQGNVIVTDGEMEMESSLIAMLSKAYLKPSLDEQGEPITDASGKTVLVSRFDFNGSTEAVSALKECMMRRKVDDSGAAVSDADGNPVYDMAWLADISNALSQTSEVWTMDGLRIYLKERVTQYYDSSLRSS